MMSESALRGLQTMGIPRAEEVVGSFAVLEAMETDLRDIARENSGSTVAAYCLLAAVGVRAGLRALTKLGDTLDAMPRLNHAEGAHDGAER